MTSLPKLRELYLDGNPCATKVEFNFELIVTLPKLKLLNDDAIKELDRDVAAQYLEMHHVKLHSKPEPKPIIKPPVLEVTRATNKENNTKKQVQFKMNETDQSDFQEDWQNE